MNFSSLARAFSFAVMKTATTTTLLLILGIQPGIAAADLTRTVDFNIPAQLLPAALLKYSEQSGVQVTSPSEILDGKSSGGVVGSFLARNALERLLTGTELGYDVIDPNTVAIRVAGTVDPNRNVTARTPSAPLEFNNPETPDPGTAKKTGWFERFRLAQNSDEKSSESEKNKKESSGQDLPAPEETGKAIPEVLVLGGKSLNMDIRRSRDDAQPYVIFERATLEQSGARNVEDFLKNRLTMNTAAGTRSQTPNIQGSSSSINLRGLGSGQTLILVDGRRLQSGSLLGLIVQGDLNGIPVAAVERIEVLPTTASGIYGGGATGGVINVILRRDYAGTDAKFTYENTFDAAQPGRRMDLSTGFTLEGGKTSILLAGTYADADPLPAEDRDLIQRGRSTIRTNNPGFFLSTTSDPILGATTNIRSATVVAGVPQNLTLKNGTALNSPFTFVPAGYAGPATDNGAALVANAGRYDFDLANSAQAGGRRIGLLNGPTVESAMATVRREFSSHLQAFLDLSAANNIGRSPANRTGFSSSFTLPSTAPNNPFNQSIRVTVPISATDADWKVRTTHRRLAAGVIVKLPAAWQVEADHTRGRSSFSPQDQTSLSTALSTAIATGAVDVLRDAEAFPVDYTPYILPPLAVTPFKSTLKDTTLRVAGPAGSLPGGPLRLSALLEYRDEDLDEGTSGPFLVPGRSQAIASAYLEALLPFVSKANRFAGVQELELQLAGRIDDYTVRGATPFLTVGSTTPIDRVTNQDRSVDPTVGLRYRPVQDLVLRASYGTGFLPPSVNQLFSTTGPSNLLGTDPRRGNTVIGAVPALTTGGNPDLNPERSESWSAGAVFTPRVLPGLRLSLDYTRIEKRDNITFLTTAQLLDNESIFASRITRGPNLPSDAPGWAGPIISFDGTITNIARAELEAFDMQADYHLDTAAAGAFDFFALATRQTHHKTQLLPTLPVVENVGVTSAFPLKFKANAGVTWKLGPWTLGWTARYFDSYKLTNAAQVLNQGSGGVIPSQTYHDAFATWSAPSDLDAGLFANVEVQLGIKNVFDKEPPFDASNSLNSFFYSTFGDPRLASYYLSLKKRL